MGEPAARKAGVIASYHFSVQILGRTEGRSAIAAAAYRAGTRLRDERSGRVADYRRRRGVGHTEILLPAGSAAWLADRERLWNGVEAMEKRVDAQLAREINLALPHELKAGQRLELLRGFVREQFVARGMVADIAIHDPVPEKGDDPRNHHAHILLTLRQATAAGLRAVKTREWNSDACLAAWRQAWAEHQNRWLRQHAPRAEPVDPRSLTAQREAARQRGDRVAAIGLDRLPELHVGVRAAHAARAGRRPASADRVVTLPRSPRRAAASVLLSAGGADASSPPLRPSQRLVRYAQIDRGSRFEANRQRIAANIEHCQASLRRWQSRSAQFRDRLHRRQRAALAAAPVAGSALIARAWPSRMAPSDRGRAAATGWGRSTLALRRIGLLRQLIALVEAVLAALLTERGRQSRRLDSLLRSMAHGLPRSPRGRRRGRRRGSAKSDRTGPADD